MHTTENMIKTLNSQIEEFMSKYPNIKITVETLTYDVVYQRMMAGINSDTVPNIFNGIEGHIAFMQSKNALAPVNDLIDEMGGEDAFITKYLDWAKKDGNIYGVPDWALHQGVWYRKDLFEKYNIDIPKTWDELRQAAKKLTMDTNGDGTIDIYGMAIPLARNMVAQQTYSQYLYSAGINIFNPETGKYEFGSKKAEAVRALDAMMQVYNESSPPGSVTWSWTEFRTALAKGDIAMTSEWGAVVAIAKEQNPDMLKNLSVFPFPGEDASVYGKTGSFGGAYYMAIGNSTDEKVAASKEFIRFMFDKDRLAERANSRPIYAVPTMKAAFNSDTYQNNDMVKMYQAELSTIFESIIPYEERSGFEGGLTISAGQIESSNIMGDALQNVVLNGWTSQQAVDYIDEKLQEIIKNAGEMK
jgi:multiple sugar transport system substrate-binding protein